MLYWGSSPSHVFLFSNSGLFPILNLKPDSHSDIPSGLGPEQAFYNNQNLPCRRNNNHKLVKSSCQIPDFPNMKHLHMQVHLQVLILLEFVKPVF